MSKLKINQSSRWFVVVIRVPVFPMRSQYSSAPAGPLYHRFPAVGHLERWAWEEIVAGRPANFDKRYERVADPEKSDGWTFRVLNGGSLRIFWKQSLSRHIQLAFRTWISSAEKELG